MSAREKVVRDLRELAANPEQPHWYRKIAQVALDEVAVLTAQLQAAQRERDAWHDHYDRLVDEHIEDISEMRAQLHAAENALVTTQRAHDKTLAQLQTAQATIAAAQGLLGLFRAWNTTPEQIENLHLVLTRTDTSAYDAAIRAAKAEARREASSEIATAVRSQLIEQTEASDG